MCIFMFIRFQTWSCNTICVSTIPILLVLFFLLRRTRIVVKKKKMINKTESQFRISCIRDKTRILSDTSYRNKSNRLYYNDKAFIREHIIRAFRNLLFSFNRDYYYCSRKFVVFAQRCENNMRNTIYKRKSLRCRC